MYTCLWMHMCDSDTLQLCRYISHLFMALWFPKYGKT